MLTGGKPTAQGSKRHSLQRQTSMYVASSKQLRLRSMPDIRGCPGWRWLKVGDSSRSDVVRRQLGTVHRQGSDKQIEQPNKDSTAGKCCNNFRCNE